MYSHDAMRTLYGDRYLTFFLGTLTNVPVTTTNFAAFVVPWNCILKAVSVAVLTGDASGSSLTAQVKRSSTVLVSSGATPVGTGANGAQTATEVNVILTKGEQLVIAALAANATDDFTGTTVIVTLEPMKQDS